MIPRRVKPTKLPIKYTKDWKRSNFNFKTYKDKYEPKIQKLNPHDSSNQIFKTFRFILWLRKLRSKLEEKSNKFINDSHYRRYDQYHPEDVAVHVAPIVAVQAIVSDAVRLSIA
jgi:hypothetical protein